MFNIKEAIEFYNLVGEFFPDPKNFNNYLDYSGIIIHNIRISKTPERFGEALLFMYPDEDSYSLSEKESYELIEMFVKGLVDNEIILLIEFCRSLW